MNPTVVAAWIAAGVSVLTLVGTLAAQYLGYRANSRDAEKTIVQAEKAAEKAAEEQRKQLDRTLTEQRDQLTRTLDAQSQQLNQTLGEQRTRTFNERFATAAGQLGSDKPPEVRLAGVYAMAGLADDWEENRQTCVDVLCAYLRMPYEPDPGQDAPEPRRLTFRALREVRHTVIRVINAHLKKDASVSWQGLNFDFTSVVFDGGDFTWARFSGGRVNFSYAEFSRRVNFSYARFSGGTVGFHAAKFSGGMVVFDGVEFSGGEVDFSFAEFSGGAVRFTKAQFSGGAVSFEGAQFSGSEVDFSNTRFSGSTVGFNAVKFSGSEVSFVIAEFSGGVVDFGNARFSGGVVDFGSARFAGGMVDFGNVADWSTPPKFLWTDTPPLGVRLPSGDV